MKDYKFKYPPVKELVIGCQFDKNILSDAQIFNIYNQIKDDFPVIENKNASPTIIEDANSYPKITSMPEKFKKYLFFTKNKNKVLQIQTNQIFFNWKKTGSNKYPSFTNVYDEFYNYLEKLSIDQKRINQLFLTYLDEFDWNNGNISEYINLFNVNKSIKHIETTLAIPQKEINSTLVLKLNSALNNNTDKRILLIDSTVRGFDSSIDMNEWFNKAHKIINIYFINIITEKSKEKFKIV